MHLESIAADRDGIGPRAATHLALAFEHFLGRLAAVPDERFLTVVTGEPHPLGNVSVLHSADDVAAAREAVAPLVESGLPACVVLPRGAGPAVAALLTERGFGIEDAMPAMAVDIDALAPTQLPEGYRWLRVGADGADGAWAEALAVGYELPPGLAAGFAPEAAGADPADDAATQYFAIAREGRLVATSALHLADGLAGIYCVATRAEERGRGLGAHATAEPLRIARRLGYRVGVLQSSHAGHPIYLKLGFQDFAQVPMRIRIPG